MMLLDMFFGNRVEILDKVCQNIDSGLSVREWGYVLVLDMGGC